MAYLSRDGGRGNFTYECEDCGSRRIMNMSKLARRSRPHCTKCGSVNLYPVTQKAKDRMLDGAHRQEYFREQDRENR